MDKQRLEVKPEHLRLIQRFCEFGAPEIDPKRPYGNSDVYQDMIEILGLRELKEGIYEFELFGEKWLLKGEDKYNLYLEGADEGNLLKLLRKLHEETEQVLQICFTTQTFKVGIYETSSEYSDDWKRVNSI